MPGGVCLFRTKPHKVVEPDNRIRLCPLSELEKHEEEFTVMWIVIEGKEDSQKKRYEYYLLDRYDKNTGTSSMARTTGYTCTAVASLFLENHFTRKGICPPEYLGATEGCLEKIMTYFEERNIRYQVKSLDDWL